MIRKAAFILVGTDHGTMIVNRFDYYRQPNGESFGVGCQLLENCSYDPEEGGFIMQLLDLKRQYVGSGVVALDCGANIGVHTVSWAKGMADWGSIVGIEAQERIFYALAGNILINNCHNARAIHAAVSTKVGTMEMGTPDYLRPGSFGSFELQETATTEYIGQQIDYTAVVNVPTISVDSMAYKRLDLIKIDVEGMEMDVLYGAEQTIRNLHPILVIEHIKSVQTDIEKFLTSMNYKWFSLGLNLLGIHVDDPVIGHVAEAPKSSN